MKRVLTLSLLAIVLSSQSSCSDRRASALADLEALSEELVSGTDNYTEEDWDIAKDQFGKICEELDQYEYTDEELKQIGKLKGKCTGIFARRAASEIKRSIHRFGKEVEGFIEGITGEQEPEEENEN